MKSEPKGFLDALADAVAERVLERLASGALLSRNEERRLLRVEEVALRLGRSDQGVYHLISHGKLPVVRSDRRVFVDSRDLDDFIESNKQRN
jgi:excisionase family DNA binding protein